MNLTESDDEKAFIYTEVAVLHQMKGRYTDADDWFRKAEKVDSENKRLYIAWAEYYDELGDYFNAQAKIGGALARIRRRDDDPNIKELMLRHTYYDCKNQKSGLSEELRAVQAGGWTTRITSVCQPG